MAEYIDIDAPIDVAVYQRNRRIQVTLRQILESNDAKYERADVRPVVRCKDCKYYYKDADGYEMCDNSEGYDHVTEDGFCAWAVKREESNEKA